MNGYFLPNKELEVGVMTNEEKIYVGKLRDKGYSYSKIAIELGLSVNIMRRLAEENTGRFSVFSGNKYLIIRNKFEKFIDESSEA